MWGGIGLHSLVVKTTHFPITALITIVAVRSNKNTTFLSKVALNTQKLAETCQHKETGQHSRKYKTPQPVIG
jgi:hypothetical protein